MKMSEEIELEKVAQQYRESGYEVFVHPKDAELPAFLSSLQPDMIVLNKSESVVVEVKSKLDLSTDHHLSYLAAVVNAQPGWRFDLVITNPWPDEVLSESTERNVPEIESLIQTTEKLVANGELEAASLIAWSALEAAMRKVARKLAIPLENKYPQFVVNTLYSEGILSRTEYEQIQESMRIRNAIAHGLKFDKLQSQVPAFTIEVAERLLEYEPPKINA
jgi:uncharacterized protein YutE (UPF0331/DUF86 family)